MSDVTTIHWLPLLKKLKRNSWVRPHRLAPNLTTYVTTALASPVFLIIKYRKIYW